MERITKFRAAFLLTLVGLVLCFFCIKLYAMQIADEGAAAINVTTYITRTRVRAPRLNSTSGEMSLVSQAQPGPLVPRIEHGMPTTIQA